MTFLEKADAGVMVFGDKQLDLHKAKQKDIAWVRKHTAFVFQNYNLFANKTALQNVMLGLTVGRGMEGLRFATFSSRLAKVTVVLFFSSLK